MKAVATSFLLAFLIVIAIIVAIFAISLPTGKTEIRIIQEELYTLQNALSAAKSYAATSATYSLYQACYDVLGSGQQIGDEQQFVAKLEESVTKNMAVYTKDKYHFLEGYNVMLPRYVIKVIYSEPGKIKLNLTGDNLAITRKYIGQPISSDVLLEKIANMTLDIPTGCYDIFIQALGHLDNVKYNIQALFDGLREVDSIPLLPNIADTFNEIVPTCERAFEIKTGSNFKNLESGIKNYLSQQIIDPYIKVKSIETRIEPELIGKSSYTGADGIPRTDISCKYVYAADLSLAVSLPTREQTYPVWNGTEIAFEPLTANFISDLNLRKEPPLIPL